MFHKLLSWEFIFEGFGPSKSRQKEAHARGGCVRVMSTLMRNPKWPFSLVAGSTRSCCKGLCRTGTNGVGVFRRKARSDFPCMTFWTFLSVQAEKKMEQRKQIEEADRAKLHQATLCWDVGGVPHPGHRLHIPWYSMIFHQLDGDGRWPGMAFDVWLRLITLTRLTRPRPRLPLSRVSCLVMSRPGDLGHGGRCSGRSHGGPNTRNTRNTKNEPWTQCRTLLFLWTRHATFRTSQELHDDAKQLMDARAEEKLRGIQCYCTAFKKHPHPTHEATFSAYPRPMESWIWKKCVHWLSRRSRHTECVFFNVSKYVKCVKSKKCPDFRKNLKSFLKYQSVNHRRPWCRSWSRSKRRSPTCIGAFVNNSKQKTWCENKYNLRYV